MVVGACQVDCSVAPWGSRSTAWSSNGPVANSIAACGASSPSCRFNAPAQAPGRRAAPRRRGPGRAAACDAARVTVPSSGPWQMRVSHKPGATSAVTTLTRSPVAGTAIESSATTRTTRATLSKLSRVVKGRETGPAQEHPEHDNLDNFLTTLFTAQRRKCAHSCAVADPMKERNSAVFLSMLRGFWGESEMQKERLAHHLPTGDR